MRPRIRAFLLAPYPKAFRAEYGDQLERYLELQAAELRYQGRLGGMRFLAEAGSDAW